MRKVVVQIAKFDIGVQCTVPHEQQGWNSIIKEWSGAATEIVGRRACTLFRSYDLVYEN